MVAQVENGRMSPITMTRASVAGAGSPPGLLAQGHAEDRFAERMIAAFRRGRTKSAMTLGMGMTESRVAPMSAPITTQAMRDGDAYRINGRNGSCPHRCRMLFLVLAQARKD